MKLGKRRHSSRSAKRFNPSRRLVGFAIVVIVLLIALGFTLAHRRNEAAKDKDAAATNLNSPTVAEKTETEKHKDDLANVSPGSDTGNTTPSGQKKSVKPVITDVSDNAIRAYVSSVFEEGGTCTATFTKDGTTLTKTSAGFKNVSYTQCTPIEYENGFLSSGKWSVTVKYNSTSAEGVSDARFIE